MVEARLLDVAPEQRVGDPGRDDASDIDCPIEGPSQSLWFTGYWHARRGGSIDENPWAGRQERWARLWDEGFKECTAAAKELGVELGGSERRDAT